MRKFSYLLYRTTFRIAFDTDNTNVKIVELIDMATLLFLGLVAKVAVITEPVIDRQRAKRTQTIWLRNSFVDCGWKETIAHFNTQSEYSMPIREYSMYPLSRMPPA